MHTGIDPIDEAGSAAVLAGRGDWIGSGLLEEIAAHPLECLETEYPHWIGGVEDAAGLVDPSERHPVFFGCYDWHSAVHSHWTLVRTLRLEAPQPRASAIRTSIDDRLTPAAVEREVVVFDDDPTFERPYGWAWLLLLAAELHRLDDGAGWRETLRPLEETVCDLVRSDLLERTRPLRVGTHVNTAFALTGVLEYARAVGASDLEDATCETARSLYLETTPVPLSLEPLGWDFLSPALVEAELLRRVLDGSEFARWLDGAALGSPPTPVVAEPGEELALHYVGLNLVRAWCLAGLANARPDHERSTLWRESARRHAEVGIAEAFTDDYAGAHWLSTFILYLLTRNTT